MGRHTTKLGEASRAETRPPLPYPVHDGRIPASRQETMNRRAQRRKSRLAALSAVSVLAIGTVTGMSIAMADETAPSNGGEVVFSGGCGALSLVAPKSNPNTSQITVTEGSQVKYTNDLGTSAELHVGNRTYGIGAGSTQVFIMNRSAEVAMVPECHGLFAQYESAQVNVVDAPTSAEQSAPGGQNDSGPSTAELPSRGSDAGSDAGSGSPSGGSGDAASGTDGAGGADGTGGTSPHGDASDAQEGGPESEEAAEEQADEETRGAEDEEMNSFGPMTDADGGAGDTEFSPVGEEVVAVDPKAVADGASGLLAMVAIVCLVGVSAAVMRTMLRQRAAAA